MNNMNKNISIIYYTANKIPDSFADSVRKQLLKSANGIKIISVSQKSIDFGENICVGDIGQKTLNIYRQALIGAKKAKTKNIALCEDDVLYSAEHFDYIPEEDIFAYEKNVWLIYTWTKPPVFSYKGRRNLYGLVCNRELFIEAMEERFAKYPDDKTAPACWGEPGRNEGRGHLKVTERKSDMFSSTVPCIAFSHPTALSYLNLGKRKRLGEELKSELPVWGKVEDVLKIYK